MKIKLSEELKKWHNILSNYTTGDVGGNFCDNNTIVECLIFPKYYAMLSALRGWSHAILIKIRWDYYYFILNEKNFN